MFLTCFDTTTFLQNLVLKSSFSRQNDADLRALNVVLRENRLDLAVILVLDRKLSFLCSLELTRTICAFADPASQFGQMAGVLSSLRYDVYEVRC